MAFRRQCFEFTRCNQMHRPSLSIVHFAIQNHVSFSVYECCYPSVEAAAMVALNQPLKEGGHEGTTSRTTKK